MNNTSTITILLTFLTVTCNCTHRICDNCVLSNCL